MLKYVQLSCLETSKLLLKTYPPLQFILHPDCSDIFLVSLGFYSEIPYAGQLKQRMLVSHCSGGRGVQDPGSGASVPRESSLPGLQAPSSVSSHGGEQARCGLSSSSSRTVSQSSCDPSDLPKVPPPDTTGLGLHHRNVGGYKHSVHKGHVSVISSAPCPQLPLPMISKPRVGGKGRKYFVSGNPV